MTNCLLSRVRALDRYYTEAKHLGYVSCAYIPNMWSILPDATNHKHTHTARETEEIYT